MDYMRGGLEIGLFVGIDFTASNGSPTDPKSLHFFNPHMPHSLNQYQQAILSIGSILLNYDSDKMVPTYGFGATVNFPNFPNKGSVSHYFPCSGSFENDHGYTVEGIFDQYIHCMRHISLNGPTYFAPLIKEVV